MDERTLIARYFSRPGRRDSSVALGIGDDAAVVHMAPGYDLVIATDAVFEGTHYPPGIPPAAVGHRALAVNLSDLAAMGAEPLWCTLALSLSHAEPGWLRDFAAGFFALADRSGISLIGGDTVRGPPGAVVTVHGRLRPGEALSRSGARPGDGIWVTGHPGEAVAGRRSLAGAGEPAGDDVRRLRQRFLYPEPRLAEGRDLVGLASAMLDVSDGLHDDLGKLMTASGAGADVDAGCLPLSADQQCAVPGSAIADALTGGDDYELLFTVPADREGELGRRAAAWPVPVTRLGWVVAGDAVRWQLLGKPFRVPDSTFRHFA